MSLRPTVHSLQASDLTRPVFTLALANGWPSKTISERKKAHANALKSPNSFSVQNEKKSEICEKRDSSEYGERPNLTHTQTIMTNVRRDYCIPGTQGPNIFKLQAPFIKISANNGKGNNVLKNILKLTWQEEKLYAIVYLNLQN